MFNLYIIRCSEGLKAGTYAAIVAKDYQKVANIAKGVGFWFPNWDGLFSGNFVDTKSHNVYKEISTKHKNNFLTNLGDFRIKGLNRG